MTATVISVILLFAGLFGMGIAVAWIIRKGNNNRLTRLFGVCQISIILWIISQLLILFSVNLQQKQLSYTVGNVGISFFAPFWLIFSAEYTEVKSRFRKFFGILSALSVSAILLIVTNPVHHLYYLVFDMDNIEYAPLFYLYQVIYYICIISGITMMYIKHAKQYNHITKQTVLLTLSTAVPLVVNTLTVTKVLDLEIELTPLFFAFSSIMILIALGKYGLLNINSIAMRDVTENMETGVIISDMNGNISYKNRYAENIISPDKYATMKEFMEITDIKFKDNFCGVKYNDRYLDFRRSFCKNNSGVKFAEIITVSDVTEYHELALAEKKLSIEQERNRIAQEIHDSAGHTFTMISSLSKILAFEAEKKNPDIKSMLGYISEVDGLSRSGLTQLRCSVNNLREDEFMTSVTQAVRNVINALRNTDVDLCVQGNDDGQYDFCIKEVYDNCREIITNAMRYSGASRIDIIVKFLAERLEVYVFDNGKGCEKISESNGLRGIRERTEKLGGSVKFSSVYGEGFSVIMKIPSERN